VDAEDFRPVGDAVREVVVPLEDRIEDEDRIPDELRAGGRHGAVR
jgi:acyl-CoA dehydrogenase